MSDKKKTTALFQKLLKELNAAGPSERWELALEAANVALQATVGQLEYDEYMENDRHTEEDKADISRAIELQREIYRLLDERGEQKS